jgi:two-component system response regulator HydG
MQTLFADRFLAAGSGWIDLATGASVRLHVLANLGPVDAYVWSDRCAMVASLRHPLLNDLVDYGAADALRVFEAYCVWPPLSAAGTTAVFLLRHAVRFFEAHGVPMTPEIAHIALRQTSAAGQVVTGRPIGIVLQRRRAFEAAADTLVDAAPGGVTCVDVAGDTGSGLRTLRLQVARAARLQGYVPVCARIIAGMPWIAKPLRERHVCVLVDEGDTAAERSAAAALLADLGLAGTRRHVVFRFWRRCPATRCLRVEPMGVKAMISMVFVDGASGPSETRLYQAARSADGNPARFLTYLRACRFECPRAGAVLVHETPPPYVVEGPRSTRRGLPNRRPAGSLLSAHERAMRLARRGRHASAVRLLTRAARVLEGRQDRARAAACAIALGWILRDRGRSADAAQQFARARALATGQSDFEAAIAIAVVWTDECRFAEAEAALRAVLGAGELIDDAGAAASARLALARCLFWQRRLEEAALTLSGLAARPGSPEMQVCTSALFARIRAGEGDGRAALSAAADAVRWAGLAGPRAAATAERAAAIVHSALGDATAVRTHVARGLSAAAEAHLPLAALRLRAALLAGLARTARPDADTLRLVAQMRWALGQRPLPPLLRRQLESAVTAATGPVPPAVRPGTSAALEELQRFIEIAHGAADDASALEAVGRAVCETLRAATVQIVQASGERRLIARAGRPWAGDTSLVDRVNAGGAASAPLAFGEPPRAAEPVRYGNEIVAVLACRWSAGAPIDEGRSGAVLRAAALAVATSVRGVLDRVQPPPAEPAWRDLIGSSPATLALRGAIVRAARAPFPVLIEGESGSGKELVARAIHRLGSRRDRRLCTLNCAALSEELLEAELFGHARGAFTGAVGERAGLFEEADGGTLFLDEVGELSPRAQAKLLRVLQDGEVRRVGENLPRRVDARVIAATNRQLDHDAEAGRFRADLRFRLDVVRIAVPPLRERPTDIPELVAHFWDEAARRVGSRASLSPDTVTALARFEWPGNVRQLQNVIASLAVHAPRRGRVTPAQLPAHVARSAVPAGTTFDAAREEFERRFVVAALARAGGQRARAARSMGVTRQGLAKMLRRLRIE